MKVRWVCRAMERRNVRTVSYTHLDVYKRQGVDVRGLRMTREYPTTLAFVQLTPEGDRSFTFYRKPGADVMLAPAEVDRALLRDCRIFHFGSVSLTDEPCRTATLEAAWEAKAAGAMISYDPNYRPFLWDSAERAREALLAALPLADIVKVSEEEMELLTGEVQLAAGADALASRGAALVLVTLGPRGAYYRAAAGRGLLPACEVDTVDTTGAGDAFPVSYTHLVRAREDDVLISEMFF